MHCEISLVSVVRICMCMCICCVAVRLPIVVGVSCRLSAPLWLKAREGFALLDQLARDRGLGHPSATQSRLTE